jgi:hypothetical protein
MANGISHSSHVASSVGDITADNKNALAGQAALPVDAEVLHKPDSKIVKVPDGEEPDPLDDLPENERAILKRQLDLLDVSVNYFTLYRYATPMDLAIIVASSICSIGAGAVLPLMAVRNSNHSRSSGETCPGPNITFIAEKHACVLVAAQGRTVHGILFFSSTFSA